MSFDIFGHFLKEPKFSTKSIDFPQEANITTIQNNNYKRFIVNSKYRKATNFKNRTNVSSENGFKNITLTTESRPFFLKVDYPSCYNDNESKTKPIYGNQLIKNYIFLTKTNSKVSKFFRESTTAVNSMPYMTNTFNYDSNKEITSFTIDEQKEYTVEEYSGISSYFKLLSTRESTFKKYFTDTTMKNASIIANEIWEKIKEFCNDITTSTNGTSMLYTSEYFGGVFQTSLYYDIEMFTTIPIFDLTQAEQAKKYLDTGTDSLFDGNATPENLEDIIIATQEEPINTNWSIYLQTESMQTLFTWETPFFLENEINAKNAICTFYDDRKNIVKTVPYNQKQITFNINELNSYLTEQYKNNGYYFLYFRVMTDDKLSSLCYAKIEPVITEYGITEPNDGSTITLYYNRYPNIDTDYDGNKDTTDDDITNVSTIGGGESSYNALNVICRTYYITTSNLRSLSQFLWSDNFTQNIKLLNNDPIENIVSCKMLPFVLNGSNATVVCGNVDTGVSAESIANNYYHVIGSINIPSYYNNFLDYAPYTKLTIFLPFIGFKEIDCNLYIGKTLKVAYIHDIITGTCKALLYSNDIYVQSFDGVSGIDIPLTASNNSQIANAFIGSAVGSVAQFFGDPIGGLLSLGKATVSSALATQHYSTQGSYSPSCGAYETHICYIIVDRPSMQYSKTYNHDYGRPCNLSQNIGNLKGFTKMCDNIDCSGISCTENEKEMIKQLLTNGIYV